MKKAFICSPFRGDIEGNTKRATYYAQITAGTDEIPIVPHLYFPIFLDENDPNQRMKGIEMGLELMDMCDEVWVFGFKITEGMRFELEHAREKRKPVRLYDESFNRINIRTLDVDDRADHEYRSIVKDLKLMR